MIIDSIFALAIATAASPSMPPLPPISASIPKPPVVTPQPSPQPGQTWEQKMLEKYNQRKRS
ncbi:MULTISPECIES: hypothetical protein [unclassified Microcoleus]|uniref:hypothetical protein n=1 Tax=unclassified Microcoleus TaxID=2642155 RepID=UPI002FCEA585